MDSMRLQYTAGNVMMLYLAMVHLSTTVLLSARTPVSYCVTSCSQLSISSLLKVRSLTSYVSNKLLCSRRFSAWVYCVMYKETIWTMYGFECECWFIVIHTPHYIIIVHQDPPDSVPDNVDAEVEVITAKRAVTHRAPEGSQNTTVLYLLLFMFIFPPENSRKIALFNAIIDSCGSEFSDCC